MQKEDGTFEEESKDTHMVDDAADADTSSLFRARSQRKGSNVTEADHLIISNNPSAANSTVSTTSLSCTSKEVQQSSSSSDSQVRKLLRQGKFLMEVTETIKTCHESKLIHYAYVLKALNVFASVNFL